MTIPRSGPAARTGAPLVLLMLLFFLSGASALVYQVLWMRLLALVFGVTVHAASTVLAAFMAGLAFGSAAAGRIADRLRHPLKAFALAEVLVAVAALATPVLLALVESVYVRLYEPMSGVPGLVTLIRLVLSFVVLLLPTTLMGATLPLVVKSALSRDAVIGRQISLLYAINTAGAITGALTAGIWLVPQLGMTWSFRIGAIINLVVGAGAFLLSRVYRPDESTAAVATDHPAPAAAPAMHPVSTPVRRLVLLTFAVSGFASFALEIIWFRMLVVLLRPTTYAFTVMLATVLGGIALGSWIATPLISRRRPHPLALLASLELLIALAAVFSMVTVGQASTVWAWAAPMFEGGRLAYFGPMAMTSIAAILPAALLMGIAFPVGIAIWASDVDEKRAGERVGAIYAINVAGAVAGSLVTGFVFLPILGSRGSLLLISVLTLCTGLLLVAQLPRTVTTLGLAGTAVVGFGAIAWATPDPVMTLLQSRFPSERPMWKEEDGHATVTILRRDSRFTAAPINRLYINGMHQASDEPGMVAYHRIIGTLPLAVHPEPRKALVIGAGGGATPGAVAAFSRDLQVDVVELSQAVLHAADQFRTINFDLLHRPNVRLRVDDGRNYMLLTKERYDVITADVILPQHAGAGNLYSAQYYELMKHVLNNRGVALQWIGSGTETEYKLIMRTFISVFPHTTLWHGGSLMVGAKRPLVLDREAYDRKLQDGDSRRALEAMNLGSFDALLSRYVAGPEELRKFVGPGPILTDDRPLTEYFLALPQNDRPIDLSAVRGDVRRHVLNGTTLKP